MINTFVQLNRNRDQIERQLSVPPSPQQIYFNVLALYFKIVDVRYFHFTCAVYLNDHNKKYFSTIMIGSNNIDTLE